MKEIHGVADATKIQAGEEHNYSVTVTDGNGRVVISIGGMTYPAGLTPDRARFIAQALNDAADRVEKPKS